MNVLLAQRIIDEKPAHQSTLFIDGNNEIRNKHIEQLFDHCFYGRDIDDIFKNNFAFYHKRLTELKRAIPKAIWTDSAALQQWISQNYGMLHVRPLGLTEITDEDYADCKYSATLRTRFTRDLLPAYAPTALHAAFLAVICTFRDVAKRRTDYIFAEAISG